MNLKLRFPLCHVVAQTMLSTSLLIALCTPLLAEERPTRVTDGVLALYPFDELGDVIHDRSGVGRPLDLKVTRTPAIAPAQGAAGRDGIRQNHLDRVRQKDFRSDSAIW